jgi:hypothetical protein
MENYESDSSECSYELRRGVPYMDIGIFQQEEVKM